MSWWLPVHSLWRDEPLQKATCRAIHVMSPFIIPNFWTEEALYPLITQIDCLTCEINLEFWAFGQHQACLRVEDKPSIIWYPLKSSMSSKYKIILAWFHIKEQLNCMHTIFLIWQCPHNSHPRRRQKQSKRI